MGVCPHYSVPVCPTSVMCSYYTCVTAMMHVQGAAVTTALPFLLMALLVVHLALLHGLGSGCAGGVLVLVGLSVTASVVIAASQHSRSSIIVVVQAVVY